MDAQIRTLLRETDTEADPMERLARLARAGIDIALPAMRTLTLKPQWSRQIRRLALDLRMMRNDEVLVRPAFGLWTVDAWTVEYECVCEEGGCDCTYTEFGLQVETDECCGGCFMVHCTECHNEITDWVYSVPSWGEWFCEACATRDLTYQDWMDAQY